MLATRSKALKAISHYVKLANGDSYLVYKALKETENPTHAKIEAYIKKHQEHDC